MYFCFSIDSFDSNPFAFQIIYRLTHKTLNSLTNEAINELVNWWQTDTLIDTSHQLLKWAEINTISPIVYLIKVLYFCHRNISLLINKNLNFCSAPEGKGLAVAFRKLDLVVAAAKSC